MAQTIKLKRGTTTPTTSDIVANEVAVDTSAQKLYVNDAGTIKEIGRGGDTNLASGVTGTLPVANGGTGATTDSAARTSLGVAIGTDVLAYDSNLQSFVDTFTLPTTDGSSGQVLATNGSGTISFSSISFTDEDVSVANLQTRLGEISTATSMGAGASADFTFASDVIVTGDLTVNGTTTTVNSNTVTIDDPIFTIGGDTAPASDDNKDRGIEFQWHNGTSAKLGFFGFDDSTGKFTFIPDATNTSEVFSGTAGTIVAALEGNVTGDVTGNADTATALATGRNFSITGDVTASAVSFDGTGNVELSSTIATIDGGTY